MPDFFELLVQPQEQYDQAITGQQDGQDDDGQHRRLPAGASARGSRPDRVVAPSCAAAWRGRRHASGARCSRACGSPPLARSRPSMSAASTESWRGPGSGSRTGRNWPLALVVRAGRDPARRSSLLPPASRSGWRCAAGRPGGADRGRQRLGPLHGGLLVAPAIGAAVRDEHLSAAVVVRAQLLRLPRQPPGAAELRRARQLREGADRSGGLGAAADHRAARRADRRRADDRGLPAGAAVREAVPAAPLSC